MTRSESLRNMFGKRIELSILILTLLLQSQAQDEIFAPEQVIESDQNLKPVLKSTCESLPSSIHITKEDHDQSGAVIRLCEGTIIVKKCEGTCVSQLQPSVTTPTGFFKECFCCRESLMKQREVLLTECFDPDGKKLSGKMSTMAIAMQEPDDCSCHKCG